MGSFCATTQLDEELDVSEVAVCSNEMSVVDRPYSGGLVFKGNAKWAGKFE